MAARTVAVWLPVIRGILIFTAYKRIIDGEEQDKTAQQNRMGPPVVIFALMWILPEFLLLTAGPACHSGARTNCRVVHVLEQLPPREETGTKLQLPAFRLA